MLELRIFKRLSDRQPDQRETAENLFRNLEKERSSPWNVLAQRVRSSGEQAVGNRKGYKFAAGAKSGIPPQRQAEIKQNQRKSRSAEGTLKKQNKFRN